MTKNDPTDRCVAPARCLLVISCCAGALFFALFSAEAAAQQPPAGGGDAAPGNDGGGPAAGNADQITKEILDGLPKDEAGEEEQIPLASSQKRLNLLELFFAGGWMMLPILVPILLMSLVVAVFGIERLLAIRRGKVIPDELVEALGESSQLTGGIEPRSIYRLCQEIPCSASTVIKAAMQKAGRPLAEIEHSIKDVSEREADRLYANVRPLTLAAAVAPLLGLLGTVLGMIMAFFETASGNVQANKAEALAEGIYTALVTTFAGLAVAIPAAMLAHWLEGRIQTLFRDIDELVLNMLPQLQKYEGKLRVEKRTAREKPAVDPLQMG